MKMSHYLNRFKNKIDYGLLTALVIPIVAILPLLTHAGLPNTADGPAHLMRQVELNQAWAEGNFYPRWGTDLALGHGMPIFSYAPPFLYHLTQLFHLTGLPLDESMKAVLIFNFLLYSLGMFLFARRIFGMYPALLAAGVYVYAPYRLREAYIQGNYGQFSGLAFYPLIFWAFHGLITDGRPRYWIAAAISLAGLLFSHNISFMIFVPILAAYLVFLLLLTAYQTRQKTEKTVNSEEEKFGGSYPPSPPACGAFCFARRLAPALARTIGGGLLGLGLAAIFWLPAFGERHDIKLEGITQGFFDFRENFIELSELISPPLPLDLTAINPEFPLGLGLPQIIGATAGILGLLFVVAKQIGKWRMGEWANGRTANGNPPPLPPCTPAPPLPHALFFTAFFLLYVFLTLPQSQIIWETVPLIELAEFPWRMLGPAIFCASLLSAAALSTINYQLSMNNEQLAMSDKKINLFIVHCSLFIVHCSLFIAVALNAYYLYPSQFIPWGTPTPADAFAYEVASGAIGTTSTGEFLPRWAQRHPQPNTLWPDYEAGRPPQILNPATLPPGATIESISHRSESDAIRVDTPQEFVATLRVLYWPGWQVYLDGQAVPFSITPNTGLIQAAIPSGRHTLTLQLETTPLRTTGLWLTLSTFAVLVIIAIKTKINKQPAQQNQQSEIQNLKSKIPPRCFTVTTILLLAVYLLSRPLASFFTLQSDPNHPQPAGQVLQVDFADQIRLVGVDAWPQVIKLPAEGQTGLTAVLYWRALQPLDTNYSIFLHLDAPNGQTFATVDEVNPENIPTRNWPPGLYLRNPLHLKIPAGLPPIRYQVTAGIYNRETGKRLPLAADKTTAFNLGSVWLSDPQPDPIPAAVASFGPHITLHQAKLADNTLTLLWQTAQSPDQNHSIFVHILDQQGNLLSQSDGVPYEGLYPLPNWRPGQLIKDTRTLDLSNQPDALSIGIYDPATGQRLPATDAQGNALPNNSFLIPVMP